MDLSIVIPAFNAQNTILNTINSIISQDSYSISYEIIIIDDGSTDNTYQICKSLIDPNNDLCVRLFTQKNQGVSVARNNGIIHSVGNKIFFLDSDDEVTSDFFKCILDSLHCDFISFGYFTSRNNITCSEFKFANSGIYSINDLCKSMKDLDLINPMCGKIFDLSIIRSRNLFFDISETFGEDTLFVYNYLRHINKIAIISSLLLKNNIDNENSLSRKYYDLSNVSSKLLHSINYIYFSDEALKNIILKIVKNYLIHAIKINKNIKGILSDLRKIRVVIDKKICGKLLSGSIYDKFIYNLFISNHYYLLYVFMKLRVALL